MVTCFMSTMAEGSRKGRNRLFLFWHWYFLERAGVLAALWNIYCIVWRVLHDFSPMHSKGGTRSFWGILNTQYWRNNLVLMSKCCDLLCSSSLLFQFLHGWGGSFTSSIQGSVCDWLVLLHPIYPFLFLFQVTLLFKEVWINQ